MLHRSRASRDAGERAHRASGRAPPGAPWWPPARRCGRAGSPTRRSPPPAGPSACARSAPGAWAPPQPKQARHAGSAGQPRRAGPWTPKSATRQPGAHLSRKRACAALPPLAQQALRTGCHGQASALARVARHSPASSVQGARAGSWRACGRRACGASAPCAAAGSPCPSPRLMTAAKQRMAGRTPRAAAGAAAAGSPAALCRSLKKCMVRRSGFSRECCWAERCQQSPGQDSLRAGLLGSNIYYSYKLRARHLRANVSYTSAMATTELGRAGAPSKWQAATTGVVWACEPGLCICWAATHILLRHLLVRLPLLILLRTVR